MSVGIWTKKGLSYPLIEAWFKDHSDHFYYGYPVGDPNYWADKDGVETPRPTNDEVLSWLSSLSDEEILSQRMVGPKMLDEIRQWAADRAEVSYVPYHHRRARSVIVSLAELTADQRRLVLDLVDAQKSARDSSRSA